MRFSVVIILLLILIGQSCVSKKKEPLLAINDYLLQQTDSLSITSKQLLTSVESGDYDKARHAFKISRYHYKKIEPIVEYYFPGLTKAMNGPPIDKVDEADDKIIEATGFQKVEEYLFPEEDASSQAKLITETKTYLSTLTRLKQLIQSNELNDQNIFEALHLHLLRVASLGLSGFDSPIAQQSVIEAEYSLRGIDYIVTCYQVAPEHKEVFEGFNRTVQSARLYLTKHQDFNAFDRAFFFKQHLLSISKQLKEIQRVVGIINNNLPLALNLNEQGITFNTSFFAPLHSEDTKKMVELGKILFFDPILSGNNSRSCSSCHKPELAFTDGKQRSTAFNFLGQIERNAPTLINAGFQRTQFWDLRVQYIEDQISDVLSNPTEMHGQLTDAVKKLGKSGEYKKLFSTAFNTPTAISETQIQSSLAAYIRSLKGLNSRFDRHMNGGDVLDKDEIIGFNLFMGKAKCGTCHFYPLFNGAVPPFYTDAEAEVIGVPSRPDTANAVIDPDLGRYRIVQNELHRFMFKIPTVRNASLSGPFMHNGVYSTLDQVIDFYNRGGGVGIGIDLPNQTLPSDELMLTKKEMNQLVKFIHALTDTTGLNSRPSRLPMFANEALDIRKVGGDY